MVGGLRDSTDGQVLYKNNPVLGFGTVLAWNQCIQLHLVYCEQWIDNYC